MADAVVTALAVPVVTVGAPARACAATPGTAVATGRASAASAAWRERRTTSALAKGTTTAASSATTHATIATDAERAVKRGSIADERAVVRLSAPSKASQVSRARVADRLANANLCVYPDANHGFLNQYPDLFADHVGVFLNAG